MCIQVSMNVYMYVCMYMYSKSVNGQFWGQNAQAIVEAETSLIRHKEECQRVQKQRDHFEGEVNKIRDLMSRVDRDKV